MRILRKAAIAVLLLAAVLAVVGFLLPRQARVERSAVIQAPQSTVFALVNGYRIYNKWSPWYSIDPSARYTREGPAFGVGAKLSWVGDPSTVGSGSQAIVESRPYEMVRVKLDLDGQGGTTAQFTLVPEGEATRITWALDADLGVNPIGRYFGLMLDRWVGPDYEKGLAGLKTLAESLPKADFAGLEAVIVEVRPVAVAYIPASSGKDEQEIAKAIGGAFRQVGVFMSKLDLKSAGGPITINTRRDDQGYGFDAAIPVDRFPEKEIPADSPVKIKQTYGGHALRVIHRGAYRGLQASYDKLFAYAAAHGYETTSAPWDQYMNDPGETKETDLITHIYLPVK